ncbi:MAG TPA: fibronectin type III domain-containing protein, partial [Labilithrix sp.]|nr:fibronectin type III domain-containing protein [Labilithrix sp.]
PLVTVYSMPAAVRAIRLGANYWARPGAPLLTSTTKLALSVSAPEELQYGDVLEWVGLRSYFYTSFSVDSDYTGGQTNVPAANATSTSDWTIDGDQLASPYGPEALGLPSAGGDLRLLQTRESIVKRAGDRFVPWNVFDKSEVIGVLEVNAPNFLPETTNTVAGTLAPPTRESITIDFKGSTFASIRQDANYGSSARASVRITMVQEAGNGSEYFASVAPESWSVRTESRPNVLIPTCFPDEALTCNPLACPEGCSYASEGFIDPADLSYTFDAPRSITTGIRDIVSVVYTYSANRTVPGVGTLRLSASASAERPRTGNTVALALELGPPLRAGFEIEGSELTSPEGELPLVRSSDTVTVRFDPPALGSPEYYEVEIRELLPASGLGSSVARILTRETSVPIPAGVLRPGSYYYARVYAKRDGRDFAEPYLLKNESRISTAVFTAPFMVEADE